MEERQGIHRARVAFPLAQRDFAKRFDSHDDECADHVWFLGIVHMDPRLSLDAGIARWARARPGTGGWLACDHVVRSMVWIRSVWIYFGLDRPSSDLCRLSRDGRRISPHLC